MFLDGSAMLASAIGSAPGSNEIGGLSTTALIMHAVDAFMFGNVLIVIAYAITFGFTVHRQWTVPAGLPQWMRVERTSKFKFILMIFTEGLQQRDLRAERS